MKHSDLGFIFFLLFFLLLSLLNNGHNIKLEWVTAANGGGGGGGGTTKRKSICCLLQIKFSEIVYNSITDILVTNEFTYGVSFITLCYDSNATLKVYVGQTTL